MTSSLPGAAVEDPAVAIDTAVAAARLAAEGGGYVRLFSAAAQEAGNAQSAQRDAGPLAGVSMAVKDIMTVAGSPLGAGSAQHDGHPPEAADAAIVAMLRRQGAIPIGLATLHEFAFGVTGVNHHTGTPRHPTDPERIPGGSSSGCAVAVAAGAAALAIGTDTGGSVRIPAALCGVVGFKPGFGEYPVDGVFPLAPSLDHVGLLAAAVTTIRRAHAGLGFDAGTVQLPLRVGISEAQLESSDPPVRAAVRHALDRLADAGAAVQPCHWPSADRSLATSTPILLAEAAAVHRELWQSAPERFGPDVRDRLAAGMRPNPERLAAAHAEQRQLRQEVGQILDEFDVVVGPTVPMVAPPLADADRLEISAALVRFTCLLNVVGVPALSLPLPTPGLPIGAQIVARSSPMLLGAAAAIERVLEPG